MRTLRYIGLTLLFTVILQIILISIVAHYVLKEGRVDVADEQHTIFQTEAKGVVYNTPVIVRHTKEQQVVILGASNSNLGLRPSEIEPLIKSGIRVHNLSIGGQNMSSVNQVVDLIYRQTPKENRHNLIFVIGSWYGLMVEDNRRWPTGRTDVDQELMRYGLFYPKGEKAISTPIPDSMLSNALISVWPYMVPYAIYAETGRDLVLSGVLKFIPEGVILPWYPTEIIRNTLTPSDSETQKSKKSFMEYVGPVDEWNGSGFNQVIELADKVKANGGKLLLIDLPITSAAKDTPAYSAYQARMAKIVTTLKNNDSFIYANLQTELGDADFFDLVHPRPKATMHLAQLTAKQLNAEILH
ncbi:hypothetical protein [Dickeya oryzae]|uniref:hypothetical protein n=1 Tax=Dickeya oryzae TaxID=1240404 RepID=UPI0003A1333F|nr:hypothetical protein [Dickeya oryzae]